MTIGKQIRKLKKYDDWRETVKKRDDFKCQRCKKKFWDKRIKKFKSLQVHHKKSLERIIKENNMTDIEEALSCNELWDINNGIVVCEKCHCKEDENQRIREYSCD